MYVKTWKSAYSEYDKSENINESRINFVQRKPSLNILLLELQVVLYFNKN